MLDPGPAALIQGDALHLQLADESVDLVVTSPPYFNLRSYTDRGETCAGQLGSEPTPAEFLAALWAATAECKRVLKPGGSIFVNLGDKYSSAAGPKTGEKPAALTAEGGGHAWPDVPRGKAAEGIRGKSLLLLPEAYRLGCTGMLAQLGGPDPGLNLIARSVIVWQKVNGLPESVRDRVRRSHEDWVHLVKSPRYYSAVDEIREPHSEWTQKAAEGRWVRRSQVRSEAGSGASGTTNQAGTNRANGINPLGKLPGSVWSVPSEPLRLPLELGIDHYAAFPSEWPRRFILGFSPPGICTGCEQGRVPVVERQGETWRQYADRMGRSDEVAEFDADRGRGVPRRKRTVKGGHNPAQIPSAQHSILGYACACTPHTDHPGSGGTTGAHGLRGLDPRAQDARYPGGFTDGAHSSSYANRPKTGGWREYHLDGWTPPPTRPAVVLDPFAGTGTTVMTARALGRYGVGVDLSFDYCRAAAWRVWEGPGVQKVRDRTWPPPPGPRRKRKPARRPGVVAGEIGLAEQPTLFAS